MIAAVVALLVSSVPPSAPALAKYAMPGLNCVNVEDKTCVFFGEYLAEQLAAGGGVEITTQAEMAAVLGLERQRQLMGCSDADTSCLAELAGALGSDALLMGSVAKVGSDYVVSAKVVRTRDARTVATASRRVRAESELLDSLGAIAGELRTKLNLGKAPAAAVGQGAAPTPPKQSSPPGRPVPAAVWATGAGGLAAGITGGALMMFAHQTRTELHTQDRDRSQADLERLIDRGELQQNIGMPLLVVGGVALAAAGGLWALDAAAPARASVSVGPAGWAFTVQGVLP